MTINSRLDRIQESLAKAERQRPSEPKGPPIDCEQVARELDRLGIARAEKAIEQGEIAVLSADEIAALKPEDSADGSVDYDQLGRWADAYYVARAAENRRQMTTPDSPAEGLK